MSTEEHTNSGWCKNNWNFIFCIILFVGFAGTLIYNTRPQSQPNLQDVLDKIKVQTPTNQGKHIVKQETTSNNTVPVFDAWGCACSSSPTIKNVSTTTTTSDIPESYVISKDDLDKALTTVAYTARKEAQSEYKDNFSILLTILTIFGIAWPVIIALLQFKFSEKELDKIDSTHEKVDNALMSLNKQTTQTYAGFAQMAYDMGCEVVERLKCYPGDGSAIRWGEETDFSPADFYFLQSINYHLLEAEEDINRLQTLAITMTIDRVTDKRSANQFDAIESCIINAERIYDATQNTDVKRILKKLKEKEKSRNGKNTASPLTMDDMEKDEHPSNEGKKTEQGEQPNA